MTVVAELAQLLDHVVDLLTLVVPDPKPEDEDVTAGWVGFVVFVGLAVAVVILGFSLVKQLRKAEAAKEAGVYGDEPVQPDEPALPVEDDPGNG